MFASLLDRSNRRILLLVGVLLVLVTLGLREVANRPSTFADYPTGVSESSVQVIVESGQTGEEIARELERLDVIASWRAFFTLAVTDSRAERIAPGSYRIDRKIPASEALEQLLDPERIEGLIALRDGVRVDEVRKLLKSLDYKDVDQVIDETRPPVGFDLPTLEGFLYPARYSFEPGTATQSVVDAMKLRFQAAIDDLDLTKNAGNFTPEEIIIIASLIEAEGTPDVFSKVSRVILNRLRIGMPLQLDSTIHYIQGSRGEISLSLNETKVKSPFNTYQNRGLPPAPIGSPTRAAIQSAIAPEAGNWIYFITVAPGDTRFTDSYQQFLDWKALYRENYRSGLFDD